MNVEYSGMSFTSGWPGVKARYVLKERQEPVHDDDEIVTCFRDGQVTLRSNRRTEGFTNAIQEHGYKAVEPGDLVVHSMDAFAGAIGVSDSRGKMSPVVGIYRVPNGDSRFYAYFLRAAADAGYIQSLAKGIRERSTSFDRQSLSTIDFPDISIEEQRRIADFLDDQVNLINQAIEMRQIQKALHLEKSSARIEKLFEDTGDSIPLKYVASKIGSGKTPRGGAEVYVEEGVVFLRSQNIHDTGIDLQDAVFIDEAFDRELAQTRVQAGDVLLNITGGSLGRVTVAPESLGRANVSQHVCIIRPLIRSQSYTLAASLRTPSVRAQINALQVGGNREGLNFEQVGNLIVRIPLSSGGEFETTLSSIQEEGHILFKKFSESLELLNERKRSLISAAVTGQMNVKMTNPSDTQLAPYFLATPVNSVSMRAEMEFK